MESKTKKTYQRRDALLLNLLKTPPQPRPKRERGKKKPRKQRGGGQSPDSSGPSKS